MNVISNAKWNAFSQFFKMSVQIINLFYLAKIIPPAEYGIMAMAVVVMNLGILLRDLGTSAAIIQKKDISCQVINSIFWLNLFIGIALSLIIIVSAPIISIFYAEKKLLGVLLLLSITFPLSSSAATHLALLERDSKFKLVSMVEVVSSLLSLIVAVVMANLGFGVYSLVAQAITLSLISAILFWVFSDWRPSAKKLVCFDDIKQVLGFSANLSLFNLINYFSRNADSLLIGKYMSAFILGSYNLAYRIMLFPLQSLSFVATRSLYPILSHHQNDIDKLRGTYINSVFFILLISAPLMSGIAVLSESFVYIFFGSKWYVTASVLKWLAPTGIIQSILSTTGAVFMAKGRTDVLMKLGLIGALLQVGAFIVGVQFSIEIFAILYLVANIINFFPVMLALFNLISYRFWDFFIKIYPIIISTIVMILVLLSVREFVLDGDRTFNVFAFIGEVFVGVSVYISSMLMLSGEVRDFLKSRMAKSH